MEEMMDGMEHKKSIEDIEIDLLLEAVYQVSGYDFRSYARASIVRRMRRFLVGSDCATISDMIGKVLHDEDFLYGLVQNVSVPVTEMFRDPFVFRTLREKVVPVLRTWPHVKIWCAGCATGEEVYSLTIVLKEEGVYDKSIIYATDFNDASLHHAEKGIYTVDKIQEATRNYQESGGKNSFSQYYHSKYGAAVLNGSLRERIVFANHNLVSDQVFGEMHLIFCRNVMIYFNRELQGRVLKLFTESLVHGGFLCLGTKEDLQFTEVGSLFTSMDDKAKLYKKSGLHPKEMSDGQA